MFSSLFCSFHIVLHSVIILFKCNRNKNGVDVLRHGNKCACLSKFYLNATCLNTRLARFSIYPCFTATEPSVHDILRQEHIQTTVEDKQRFSFIKLTLIKAKQGPKTDPINSFQNTLLQMNIIIKIRLFNHFTRSELLVTQPD